ncbi:MAG: Proline dehydrogenase 1 [Candidatus Heimdallarchaeota archaeon LC_2]|nr:MAG: Proline dehydrogenase 1 [Candidatus Heimdallarchaeota archaeon LC_2]
MNELNSLRIKEFLVKLLPGFLIRYFARPYVSGDSIEKGIAKADDLWLKRKISSTLDLLGEEVYSKEEVEENVTVYLELLDKLEGKNYVTVSLKPSSLGYNDGIEYCQEIIERILIKAKEVNIPITLDMEDFNFTDDTLIIYKNLLRKFPNFGTVIQSRLFRTQDDILSLKEHPGRIRLCIGIYKEDKDIALTNKAEMKQKLVEFAELLINQGNYVEVATHDSKTLEEVLALAEENSWTSDQLEFQQLMGVPMSKMQTKLLEKHSVRLYVPFATHWDKALPYLRRRMINNPGMGIYVLKNLFKK